MGQNVERNLVGEPQRLIPPAECEFRRRLIRRAEWSGGTGKKPPSQFIEELQGDEVAVTDETARVQMDMELALQPVTVRLVGYPIKAHPDVHGTESRSPDEEQITGLFVELPEQVVLVHDRVVRGFAGVLETTDADAEVTGSSTPERLAELVAEAQHLGPIRG